MATKHCQNAYGFLLVDKIYGALIKMLIKIKLFSQG